ncbi:uncharacterized protein EDB93DRAFT_1072548, partial [Suillus bovinus]|uniref:uncharacterized protein n=1 Tax=Suillus bovinus TaxID=48563 RepID=UPI001B875CA6
GYILLSFGCFTGAVFGGIHCLGWDVLLQGRAIWRVASLSIASVPIAILLLNISINWLNDDSIVEALLGFVWLVSLVTYIVARVTLIVLILMSFRSLPPGVYETVAWTKFIP